MKYRLSILGNFQGTSNALSICFCWNHLLEHIGQKLWAAKRILRGPSCPSLWMVVAQVLLAIDYPLFTANRESRTNMVVANNLGLGLIFWPQQLFWSLLSISAVLSRRDSRSTTQIEVMGSVRTAMILHLQQAKRLPFNTWILQYKKHWDRSKRCIWNNPERASLISHLSHPQWNRKSKQKENSSHLFLLTPQCDSCIACKCRVPVYLYYHTHIHRSIFHANDWRFSSASDRTQNMLNLLYR